MSPIQVGAKREEKVMVDDSNAINFLGLPEARVLSTPHMIGYMERTSRNLLAPMLPEGDDSVGTVVNVAHLGGAPMGTEVTFTSEIIAAEGRRVTFRVSAAIGKNKVGEGTHERYAVTVERFAEKMAKRLAES